MRLAPVSSLAVLALAILLHSPGALRAEPAEQASPLCNAQSAREAIASAEKALRDKSASGANQALLCLLAVVKEREEARLDAASGKEKTRSLSVPLFIMPRTP